MIDIIKLDAIVELFKRAWKSNTAFSDTRARARARLKEENSPEIQVSVIGEAAVLTLSVSTLLSENIKTLSKIRWIDHYEAEDFN